MQMTGYYIIHFLCSGIATVVVYKLMRMIFGGRLKNRRIEVISFISYFILSLLCYYLLGMPIVMLVFNLLYFFVLTLNYKADLKQHIFTVVYIYSILFCVEMLVAALTGYIHFPLGTASMYSSIFGQIANQLVGLTIVCLLSCFKKKNDLVSLPWIYWLCMIIMPAFSLYFLVIIFHMGNLSKIHVVLCSSFILLINFSVVILYDRVVANMVNSTRNILSIQQIKYYEQQLEIMQTSIKANHSLLHDLKSHLIALKSCLKEGEIEEALAYIERMLEFNTTGQTELAKTGNKIIDSIINFKLQEAIDKKIDVTAKIKIPEALEMDSFDATVIIGNILDNAIEAASKAEHERKLNVLLIYDRRRIVFEVDNTYSGCINMEQGALRTNKENWLNHGIGLQNVGLVAEKYNGTVDINFDDNWFNICVMFYT